MTSERTDDTKREDEEYEEWYRHASPDELAVHDLMVGPHSAEGQIEREAAGYGIKFRDDEAGTATHRADAAEDGESGEDGEHGEDSKNQ
jgi:hypothetical protein